MGHVVVPTENDIVHDAKRGFAKLRNNLSCLSQFGQSFPINLKLGSH